MLFGAIADDVTGATDLASVLLGSGCRVVLTLGIPDRPPPPVDAIVVATKLRMEEAVAARAIAAEAVDFLERAGASQYYFKYCSTFDSTDAGNIGPVTDFLLDRLGQHFTIACPAYPALARTTYQGHLFVGDRLLSKSSMRDHPLTPMRDPDIVRVLARQTPSPVALAPLAAVEAGPAALAAHFRDLQASGIRMAVVDAIGDRHIETIAAACRDMPLVTGGAALGGALGAERLGRSSEARTMESPNGAGAGPTAMLSGSCSAATQAQIAAAADHIPSLLLDPVALARDPGALADAAAWAVHQASRGDFLVYSTADPQIVADIQSWLGRDAAAASLERAFAGIARALAAAGVRRFVVAGGETSGAVTNALGIRMMTFGPDLAPGVPWVYTLEPEGYTLALKSGNFGQPDFFLRARGTA